MKYVKNAIKEAEEQKNQITILRKVSEKLFLEKNKNYI